MKQLLLFLAALLTATATLAQEPLQEPQPCTLGELPSRQVRDLLPNRADIAKKVAEQTSLIGSYVEDGIKSIHNSKQAAIYEYSGDTVVVVLYNGYAQVLGVYDAEAGTVTVQNDQVCYQMTSSDGNYTTYGDCYFLLENISVGDDGTPENYVNADIVFTVNDDQTLSMQGDGYYIIIYGGNYDGKGMDYNLAVTLFPVNATQTYARYASGKYTDYEVLASVEDFGEVINVYNFLYYGLVEMTINDDLTVSVATHQPLKTVPSSYSSNGYGDYCYLIACDISTGKAVTDYDIDSIPGVLDGDTIKLSKQYFQVKSELNDEGKGLSYGTYKEYKLTLNSIELTAGIKEAAATREEQIRSTYTYNLMGQRVNRDTAKGLLIRGGKKYIKR